MNIPFGDFNIDNDLGSQCTYFNEIVPDRVIVAHNCGLTMDNHALHCEYRIICEENSADYFTCSLIIRPEQYYLHPSFNVSDISPCSFQYSLKLGQLNIAREHLQEGIDFLKKAVDQIRLDPIEAFMDKQIIHTEGDVIIDSTRKAIFEYWITGDKSKLGVA